LKIVQTRLSQKFDNITLGLFLLSGLYIFYNLGGGSLYAWDEAWYGEVAREMVSGGKGWFTFYYNYQPFFDKPPLYIWLIAIAYKILGVNEFAVRIWSAIFGFGSIVLIYFLAEKLFPSKQTAFYSSLVLVGFHHFVQQSRMGMMDVPLTFFILLGITFFWIGRTKDRYLLFVGISAGLAFMIKSVAAFQLPAIIVLYALISGELKNLINPKLLYGFFIGILICLPWHLYQYGKYGHLFINEYFLKHVVKRTFETLDEHQGNVFYYFKIIFSKNNPLGLVSFLAVPYIIFSAWSEKDRSRRSPLFLVISAITVTLSLFSLVKTKLPGYIIPVYPFLSLSIVAAAGRIIERAPYKNSRLIAAALTIILITIPSAGVIFDRKYRSLDYNRELKDLSVTVKDNSSASDTFFLYRVKKVPVAIFYSEREISTVEQENILSIISSDRPFICLMIKEDGFFSELKNKINGLTVLGETDKYILYRK